MRVSPQKSPGFGSDVERSAHDHNSLPTSPVAGVLQCLADAVDAGDLERPLTSGTRVLDGGGDLARGHCARPRRRRGDDCIEGIEI